MRHRFFLLALFCLTGLAASEEASPLTLAQQYEEQEKWDLALLLYLQAFQENPASPEPLQRIAHHYRIAGKNELAVLFAKHGSRIPIPKGSSLQPYQFDEELSIAAYYTRFRDDGFAAANSLVLRKNVPWQIKEQTYRNMLYYVKNLEKCRYVPFNIPLPDSYSPMNPSIIKTETGYTAVSRSVNYTQTGAKFFETKDPNGIYRTRNFLVDLDMQLRPLSYQEITENLPREKFVVCVVEGLEDCRLVSLQDGNWFTCTTSDTNPTGQRQISLCKLPNTPAAGGTRPIEKLVPLLGPDPYRCEKNWLPFALDGNLYAIYSYDPFIIYKPDLETGECPTLMHVETPYNFSSFRGSASPIPFDDGHLVLVHEVVTSLTHERCYLHRFLFLDKNFTITKLSKPFTFRHQGVEFCLSMTPDHENKRLILAVGIEDRESYFCLVELNHIRTLLEPLHPVGPS